MSVQEIAKSLTACLIKAEGAGTSSQIWFKSKPVDRSFCYRAMQLQLCTDSCDQGRDDGDARNPDCGSWFEIVVLPDASSDTPRIRDGKELAWRSHGNGLGSQDTTNKISRSFGKVFSRGEGALEALEIGNVIGVRVCARYDGWMNDARQGYLAAKVLHEDAFTPTSWTLSPSMTPEISDTIENGVYTLNSSRESHIQARDSNLTSEIWFTTPILNDSVASRIENIQLFTAAHCGGHKSSDTSIVRNWFDLVILDGPESKKPKVKEGRSLVWFSHSAAAETQRDEEQQGKVFSRLDQILTLIEPGNVIGVRVCAQFKGRQTHASNGRLVVRIANKGPCGPPSKPIADWESVRQNDIALQKGLGACLQATGWGSHTITSIESELLRTRELRADLEHGAGERPLKLLSLDGGGVRGVSSLYILKDVMSRVAGDPNAKPCDYFDMMAGTSTGGLIAIMLGRLRMSVDDCIQAYERMASKIFGSDVLTQVADTMESGARYSGEVLENAIKEVVRQCTGDADAPMRDPSANPCKVFVLACRADDISNRVATHLRTYSSPHMEKSFADYKIWEAARATSAAPTYFPRIKLGDHEYIDGGVGSNNPVLLLMGEARLSFGSARKTGCLVTLGTGMTPNVSLPPDGNNVLENAAGTAEVMKCMWSLATASEQANQVAKSLVDPGHYFRFNVGRKIAEKRWVEKVNPTLTDRLLGRGAKEVEHFTPEDWAGVEIDLADYKKIDVLIQMTKEYLKGEVQQLADCAAQL